MIDWLHENRLDHALVGFFIMMGWALILALFIGLPWAFAIGWLLQCQHWWSREVRDTEIHLALDLPGDWFKAWDVRVWSDDSKQDFRRPVWMNAIACVALVVVISV
jgi:hypothetical protein